MGIQIELRPTIMSSNTSTKEDEECRRFKLRNVEKEAAFFLPHLRPGIKLLDAGCGPGSITFGFAEQISPGTVVGIDTDQSRIEAASQQICDTGVDTISFLVADVNKLPFDTGSFDAVFANGLIEHLPIAYEGIYEMMRVLKPGGIIGLRSPDWGVALIYPDSDGLRDSIALRNEWQRSKGGNPEAGRMLRGQLIEAGFENVLAGSTADSHGTDQGVTEGLWYMQSLLNQTELIDSAEENNWASPADMDRMRRDWEAWAKSPEAFASFFWCHAIGRKPG